MKLSGNTILITGAGSGIGLAFAEALTRLGNDVVVAARSPNKIARARQQGLRTLFTDISDAGSVQRLATQAIAMFPALNVVMHNAAISRAEDLIRTDTTAIQEQTIATNLLGPLRLTNALLPHLLEQPTGAIIIVSSGLGFVPSALYPTYSATKAALHSYSQSLRFQLRETDVEVIEIIPPYVQTELGSPAQATDPNAMPLAEFTSEAIEILQRDPNTEEVVVERAVPHRVAAEGGRAHYADFFRRYNSRFIPQGMRRERA